MSNDANSIHKQYPYVELESIPVAMEYLSRCQEIGPLQFMQAIRRLSRVFDDRLHTDFRRCKEENSRLKAVMMAIYVRASDSLDMSKVQP